LQKREICFNNRSIHLGEEIYYDAYMIQSFDIYLDNAKLINVSYILHCKR
jgi:hypothetical protein